MITSCQKFIRTLPTYWDAFEATLAKDAPQFTFVELFATLGGFTEAAKQMGGKCLWTHILEPKLTFTYLRNHGNTLISPYIVKSTLCDFMFSKVDKSIQTCDFINEFLSTCRPKMFVLEGRKNTTEILKEFSMLEYRVFSLVINAKDYGVPQDRIRHIIVGVRSDLAYIWQAPRPIPLPFTMTDVLGDDCNIEIGRAIRPTGRRAPVNDHRCWDGYVVAGKVIRLDTSHMLKMMGFPPAYKLPKPLRQAVPAIGNEIVISMIKEVIKTLAFRHKQ